MEPDDLEHLSEVGEPPPTLAPPPSPAPGPRVGLHTEPEWLAETDPERLLRSAYPDPRFDLLRMLGRDRPPPPLNDRKLWLLAVACCRRVWPLMTDGRTRRVVEVVERWADGRATDEERSAAALEANQAWSDSSRIPWGGDVADAAHQALHATTTAGAELARPAENYQPGMWASAVASAVLIETARAADPNYQSSPERPAQAGLIRCLAGNPFRPVSFDPAWPTPTVVGLAEEVYAERAWHLLPVLADALEDAGYADADVLAHFRGGGPHARGCWVVDRLLGRGPDAPARPREPEA